MSDPDIALIQNAAEALNTTDARINAFLDNVDADVLAAITEAETQLGVRQAGYDTLAGDLKAVISTEMYFQATVDPGLAVPTNVAGGSFNTIKEAVDAAPASSYVFLKLVDGVDHIIDGPIATLGRKIYLGKQGANRAKVRIGVFVSGGFNKLAQFGWSVGFSFYSRDVDFTIDEKADPNIVWGGDEIGFFGYGPWISIGLRNAIITAPADVSIAPARFGAIVNMSLLNVTLDGAFHAVKSAANGVVSVSTYSVTLLNGAAIVDGGTVGTNILQV